MACGRSAPASDARQWRLPDDIFSGGCACPRVVRRSPRPRCLQQRTEASLKHSIAALGLVLLATPVAAQPIIIPLQKQRQTESPLLPLQVPVAPPESAACPASDQRAGPVQVSSRCCGPRRSSNRTPRRPGRDQIQWQGCSTLPNDGE
jgi:hypothetical protein